MNALPRHHRPIMAGRLLCLMVLAILLANPVLATVSAALACNGRCGCCADAEETAAVTVRSLVPANDACCRSTDTTPCNMSARELPDAAPALVPTPDRQSTEPIYPLVGNCCTAADLLQSPHPGSRVNMVLALPDPPLYLRTCRLIC
ncbi:MAG: hypothetical protein V2I40_04585 [Desulfobacteraceae bacterium]|nr:hypothetical protein [Desulfobacteraceae bacterium]